MNSFALSSSAGAAAQMVPGAYGRGIELSGFRVRAGVIAFFQTEVLTEAIVPLLSPHTSQHADLGRWHI